MFRKKYLSESNDVDSHRDVINFSVNGSWTILKGACYSSFNHVSAYNGFDVYTGELYMIKEISVANAEKEKIEIELKKLVMLQHDNLFPIKSFKCENVDEDRWNFYILQKFDFGFTNISLFSRRGIAVSEDALRNIAKDILSALEYLYLNDVKTVSIFDTSVFINDEGQVKLYDFGIEELKCNDMDQNYQLGIDCNVINLFAVVLLALRTGKPINETQTLIPHIQSGIFQDFFHECYTTKSYDHSSIEKLLNHVYIQEKCDILSCISLPERPLNNSFKGYLERKVSRVETDFKILEELGRGNYGKVFKVQDKVDGKCYALKQVKLDHKQIDKTLKEAKFLALLEHENIVRYYHSWTDYEDQEDETDSSEDSGTEVDSSQQSALESTSTGVNFITSVNNNFDEVDGDNESICFPKNSNIENIMEFDTSTLPDFGNTLYIKMEFCESKTLKSAIDDSLYLDRNRIWKFLNEIVAGLRYIHDLGIIHRDLKPINIFLDNKDHVKIGDFGFATTNLKYSTIQSRERDVGSGGSGSYTSRVGTTFYRAPELLSSAHVYCDQKLDMYSLGIILFEMCYKPMNTGHERTIILEQLRCSDIQFPSDYSQIILNDHLIIIRNLLNHSPERRPSCEELINSNLPSFEEEEKKMQIIRKVIDNPELRLCKYLYQYLFASRSNTTNSGTVSYTNINQVETIIRIISDIFRKHGGKNFDIGIKSVQTMCKTQCGQCTKMVDMQGHSVVFPCNDRRFFAQYVVSKKNVPSWLRRYSIQKIPGFEANQYNCIFDIVTNVNLRRSKNFLPDAEIMHILSNIKHSFIGLKPDNFTLLMNHTELIQTIFDECGILKNKNQGLISLISSWVPKGTCRKQMLLQYMKRSDCEKYIDIMDTSYILNRFDINLILKNFKDTNRDKVRKAVTELRRICDVALHLGVMENIVLDPSCMLHMYESYSGMLIQLEYRVNNKSTPSLLANGGRYDAYLKSAADSCNSKAKKYGIGISVFPANIQRVSQREKSVKPCEVVICFNSKSIPKKVTETLQNLWAANIPCSFIKMQSKKHAIRYCSKNNVPCFVLMSHRSIKQNRITIVQQSKINPVEYIIGIEDLVPAVEAILYCHPEKIAFTTPTYFEAPLIFRTNPELTINEKFKSKIRILQLIKDDALKTNSIILVINSTEAIINDFIFRYHTDQNSMLGNDVLRRLFLDIDEHQLSINSSVVQVIFINIAVHNDNVEINNVFKYNMRNM